MFPAAAPGQRGGADAVIVTDTAWLYYEVSTYQTAQSPVFDLTPAEHDWGSLAMLEHSSVGRAGDLVQLARDRGSIWVVTALQKGDPAEEHDGLARLAEFTVTDPITGRDLYLAAEYAAA
jgi:hypothetical protein